MGDNFNLLLNPHLEGRSLKHLSLASIISHTFELRWYKSVTFDFCMPPELQYVICDLLYDLLFI